MLSDIKISVIIPFYKGDKYIEQCTNSVLSQPYKGIEIVLINDGSPTGSELCERLADKDKRIHYYKKVNEGIGATRNFGIEKATGNYLAFLDQDDIWAHDFLDEELISYMVKGGSDAYCFSYYGCNRDFTRGKLVKVDEKVISGSNRAVNENRNHHSSIIFNSGIFKDSTIRYALTRHEDVILLQKVMYISNKIEYIDKIMFLYRNNPTSETHRAVAVEDLYGSLLNSWKDLLKWQIERYPSDLERINTIRFMICVYAMEGIQQLYRRGISMQEGEKIIDDYLCGGDLEEYKETGMFNDCLESFAKYNKNKKKFIKEQRRIGITIKICKYMTHTPILRRIYENLKYPIKMINK